MSTLPREPSVAKVRVVLRANAHTNFKATPSVSMHAALHRLLETYDHALGYEVHNSRVSALTISPVFDLKSQIPVANYVACGCGVCVWIATLSVATTRALPALLAELQSGGGTLSLEWSPFSIEMVSFEPPCSGLPATAVSYAQILDLASPASTIVLHFSSPTMYRQGHANLIAREGWRAFEPRLVFGSILQKWTTFAGPTAIRLDLETITRNVRVVAGAFETAQVDVGKAVETGFTGWARYEVVGNDAVRSIVNALASFAEICGVGARTAYGLGQTRRLL